MASPTPDSGTFLPAATSEPSYAHSRGDVPLTGYTLTEPLGRGGFGEVWACVAPGGLKKAVKFVSAGEDGDGIQFRQEMEAFEQIKEIRHPFLLTLERVEVVGNELVMVMELADEQLLDRYNTCRAAGLRGVPRDELLGYMMEAAEALDVISERYGLQHLDVKPANLFVTAGHVKVGDYGLVSKLDASGNGNRGLTPKYVAPEVLRGTVHLRSDQYSLALVYAELQSGVFPYPARTPQQMMLAHISSTPDVSALPKCDQGPVFAALQKRPEDRFPTCRDFVQAMRSAVYVPSKESIQPIAPPPAGRSTILPRMTRVETTPSPGGEQTSPLPPPGRGSGASVFVTPRPGASGDGPRPGEITKTGDWKTVPRLITPGSLLLTPGPRTPPPPPTPAPSAATPPAQPPSRSAFSPIDEDLPVAEPEGPARVRVNPIRSVIPAGLLRGENLPRAVFSGEDFASAVVRAAAGAGQVPQMPGDLGRTADGRWVCQFPSTVPPQVAALKLGVLKESWHVAVDIPESGRIVLQRAAGGGGWFSSKKSGFEVAVAMPRPGKSSLCEVTLTGSLFGTPDRQFVQVAQDAIPRLLADVRRELGNVQDRRRAPRLAAGFGLTVHPLHSDGHADEAVRATCLDVSSGGAAFTTRGRIDTKYAYLEFEGVPALAGLAVLVRVIRAVTPLGMPDAVYGVQYRIDL